MSDTEIKYSGGIGLPGVLFCIFLVLKLVGTINWSWWWVTCPLWIPVALGISIVAIVLFILAIAAAIRGFSS